ncbi:Stage II sporulation protein E (SpoIIE) [Nonomuraea maritima]|uniref:Stage II sporulation protein E (SpoIIE) n=1 Tax=Nonomuraea maritima TaxID=683260 RepID=A0A1G9EKT2_9ACTN|nr:PP2C family protein-serine/threonine phosphatase [Nonomuraea maritima]SDK76746.1 Stage II sporulation protein E (SpoIIE) [Nonomuraea maritima]
MGSDGERVLGGLLQVMHMSGMEDLPREIASHARHLGFSEIVIYTTDLQQQLLVPLPAQEGPDGEPPATMRIDGTVAGRAYRRMEIVRTRAGANGTPAEPEAPEETPEENGTEEHGADDPGDAAPGDGSQRLWAPLLDGTERLGVLGVTVPCDDDVTETRVKHLASLVALLIVSKRPHSDSYARIVRSRPLTLSAEVLWNLLPPGTFATEDVVVSTALEPAYEMGGDAYDYALDGRTLNVAIFDAMGHDTSAGLTATIAIGSIRNSRRRGMNLPEAAAAVDAAIQQEFSTRFATGVLAELDLDSGVLTWVNRGHHPPLLLREGRLVATLESVPDPPMGLGLDAPVGQSRYQLQPGDRLLFYTDGVIEAQSPGGERFGLERFIDFVVRWESSGMSAPETLRRLIQTILEHQSGWLQDDATVLTVGWRAPLGHRLTL